MCLVFCVIGAAASGRQLDVKFCSACCTGLHPCGHATWRQCLSVVMGVIFVPICNAKFVARSEAHSIQILIAPKGVPEMIFLRGFECSLP